MKNFVLALAVFLTFGLTVAVAGAPVEDLYAKKCAKCHGNEGEKSSGASGGIELKGQSVDELRDKLMGYKDGSYGGKKKATMKRLAAKLDDEQIAGLAKLIGGF